MPKNAVGGHFSHSLVSGIEKVWIRGGGEEEGSITIFCRKFLFHNAENFCRGTLLCCVSEKFRQQKSIRIRVGGGGIKIFRRSFEVFSSHSAEKRRWGTF